MIRTSLSVFALFGTLLLVAKWVGQSNASPPVLAPAAATAGDRPAATPSRKAKPAPAAVKPTAERDCAAQQTSAVPNTFEMPEGCVEASAIAKPIGMGDDGVQRIGVADYLRGGIPSPRDYAAHTTAFEAKATDKPATDATDDADLFGDLVDDEVTSEATDEAANIAENPNALDASEEMTGPASDATGDETDDAAAGEKTETTAPSQTATVNEEPGDITPVAPRAIPAELSPEMLELREKLRACLGHYYYRPENVANRSPWGAMHYMLAYGVDSQFVAGDRRVNACGWLCYNGVCNGQNLFQTDAKNRLQCKIGVGVQGHAGQYLSMLAQSKVPTDFPIKTGNRDFTVVDLIAHEKASCKPNTELTFKLIALMHYCKSDDSWVSDEGQEWDIPRLIKEELKQPIVGAACGGTHRLMGLSYAIKKRDQRGEEFNGQWLRAQKFINDYHAYAFRLQNPDGSFSTDWFAGRADFGPPSRRLETTGHITEWLTYSLSDEEVTSPKFVKSVNYLTDLLYNGRNDKWNIGPLGHGLHALAMYDERVFGGKPGERQDELARYNTTRTANRPPQTR